MKDRYDYTAIILIGFLVVLVAAWGLTAVLWAAVLAQKALESLLG